MSKVLVLGIDAMDIDLLSRFEDRLPNFRQLKSQNPAIRLTSVCPPDTPTAWASAYTGLNPAQHGIIYFVDPLDKVSILASMDLSSDPIRGKTFWDVAGSEGKRCCVLFPFLGYPVWEINGIMVGRSTNRYNKGALVQISPPSLQGQYDLSSLNPIFTVPQKRRYPSYIEAYRRLLQAEKGFGLQMLRRESWDIFFLYSSALDWLGHNLWSYFDESDPAYPGDNPFKAVFPEFYQLYDDMLGDFIAEAGSDTTVIIFSDHGFTQRPAKLLNINELLRDEGLLVPRMKRGDLRSPAYALEMFKRGLVSVVNRTGAGATTMWLVHHLPALRRRFTLPQSIDWENTPAYISDLSGIKAYSYGGIIIARDKLGGRDYEQLRTYLISEIGGMKEPGSGEPLVKWICRREELYAGPYLAKYPDIVFQLKDDYGAGWSIYEPLITDSPTHNIQPGTHKADSAVLLVSDARGRKVVKKDSTLMDIACTVLSLQGITPPFPVDGESLLEAD